MARASELEQARAASERGALADLQQAEQELAIAEAELRKAVRAAAGRISR